MITRNILMGANTSYPLRAILTLPDQGAPFPAVVLVQGTGILDVDGKTGPNTPAKDIAEGLVNRGIAVIRYYKRSFLYPNIILNSPDATVWEDMIYDAIQAAEVVKAEPQIDENRVFMVGHELGGMLAPRINLQGGDFAGLVIMAGSPRKLEDVLLDQYHATTQSLKGLARLIAAYQAKKIENNMGAIRDLEDVDAKNVYVIKPISAYYFKEMGYYPTPELLRKTKIPMLFLHGEKDFQISTEKDFESYKKILYGRKNVTFQSYPDLNHYFMSAHCVDIAQFKKEYKQKNSVSETVLDDIVRWILLQGRLDMNLSDTGTRQRPPRLKVIKRVSIES